MIAECECCGRLIKTTNSSQKYCNNCSLHTYKLRQKIGYLAYRLKIIKKKYYRLLTK